MEETKVEEQKRLSNWDNFLITGEEDESRKASKISESKDQTGDLSEVGSHKGETNDVDNEDDYFDEAEKDDTDREQVG